MPSASPLTTGQPASARAAPMAWAMDRPCRDGRRVPTTATERRWPRWGQRLPRPCQHSCRGGRCSSPRPLGQPRSPGTSTPRPKRHRGAKISRGRSPQRRRKRSTSATRASPRPGTAPSSAAEARQAAASPPQLTSRARSRCQPRPGQRLQSSHHRRRCRSQGGTALRGNAPCTRSPMARASARSAVQAYYG